MAFLTFIIIALFLLAITDLVVGVSNDAVNFLNSAIGSRVARFQTIILVAAAGIILGSVFSSGIMEIARKGVFHPEFFTLSNLLLVFLAVMITDIILLDVFNSLGLPTSTTVAIIFELLGASLITGILISVGKDEPVSAMMKYINAESVLTIITGIFLSIFIAFTSGILIQYISRLIFTFNYENNLKKYGAFFAGLGITSIVYFLLIKGLKGTNLLSPETALWVKNNTLLILSVLFAAGFLLCLLLQKLAGVNPLKVVVLMGTFSLAMAFAGNDLVNFIGVPITGYLAFENWRKSGVPADEHTQEFLAGNEVVVPTYMLVIAGIVMALTLWLSSKARKVTETEVNLGSQQEGEERFKPNNISRSIVKTSMRFGNLFSVFIPKTLSDKYNLSFEKSKIRQATEIFDKPAFDLVRAANNLVIASILIAMATTMKLPLSTTYVSFMVAMGTSLADRAWGKETAVYRVAGVLSVIGGWLITALIAFLVSGFFALFLYKTEMTGAIILLAATVIYMIHSNKRFSRKEKKEKEGKQKLQQLQGGDADILQQNRQMVTDILGEISLHYGNTLDSLKNNQVHQLEKANRKLHELVEYGFKLRAQSIRYIKSLNTDASRPAEILLYSSDLLQDITGSALALNEECLHYIKNLHREPDREFILITEELKVKLQTFISSVSSVIIENKPTEIETIKVARDDVRHYINEQLNQQVGNIQQHKPGVKQAILQTSILLQSRDILAVTLRILKMYKKYFQPK